MTGRYEFHGSSDGKTARSDPDYRKRAGGRATANGDNAFENGQPSNAVNIPVHNGLVLDSDYRYYYAKPNTINSSLHSLLDSPYHGRGFGCWVESQRGRIVPVRDSSGGDQQSHGGEHGVGFGWHELPDRYSGR